MKVAIIGGGVIGLYIGLKLSEQGREVVIFEKKKKEVADFKCCSGLVSERIINFIPIKKDIIKNRISFCKIVFPKKTIKLMFDPNHLVLDREAMIRQLIELNERAGTEIRFGSTLNSIPEGFDRVIITDGANSFYGKKVVKNRKFKLGVQLLIEKKDNNNFVETYPIKNGFCWKIPRGDMLEYGALSSYDIVNVEFDKFLRVNDVNKNQGAFYSAVVPQPSVLNTVNSKKENIFLCGDSMGLVKPWSGGGIIWGLTAADILIKNIDNRERYEREVKSKFRWNIAKGYCSNAAVKWAGNNCSFVLPNKIRYDNDFPNVVSSLFSLIKK